MPELTTEQIKKIQDALPAALLETIRKPNPLFVVMMGHHKWYVKPFIRFAPKYIHTFTQRRKFDPSRIGDYMPIEHGYTSHHPLEFLYKLAKKIATRKQRWAKDNRVSGHTVTFSLNRNA